MASPSAQRAEPEVHLSSLSRLRWAAVAGELLVLVVVHFAFGAALPAGALALVVLAQVATGAAALMLERRRSVTATGLTALLAADVVTFTALLALTGGAANPFSFLYLVYIAFAAFMLKPRHVWLLVALSTLGFASLFALDAGGSGHGEHMHHGAMSGGMSNPMQLHLVGMWGAFVVAAVFIVVFMQRLLKQLQARERALDHLKAEQERATRLAALGTLAAGAAHELATPLSTIAVASAELAEGLSRSQSPDCADLTEEANVIRTEVDRCRGILEQLAVDAGTPVSASMTAAPLGRLLDGAVPSAQAGRVRVVHGAAAASAMVRAPVRLCARALRGVVENALRASADDVTVEVDVVDGRGLVVVRDAGEGMDPDVLARAGEPFFTTQATGEGMGLGLFVARSVFEGLGGAVEIVSTRGKGTTVTLSLPLARERTTQEAA